MYSRTKKILVKGCLRAQFGPSFNHSGIDNVALFPGLGLAFNRIPKNANTTSLILLNSLETGSWLSRDEAKDTCLRFYDLPLADLVRARRFSTFVITRNPYSRALSAFLDKFRTSEFGKAYGEFEMGPGGFLRFLNWVRDGNLCRNRHWDLQVRAMMLPLEKYDSVLRFEAFSKDIAVMLRKKGIQVSYDTIPLAYPSDEGKPTHAVKKLEEYYSKDAKARVAEIYKRDFESLGYSLEFPSARR